jgi:26S proteasome regulatory subunit N1
MNLGIRDEIDSAKAMLEEYINSGERHSRLGGLIGLGFAYAGSCRQDILEILIPYIADVDLETEFSAMAALSLGLVFCGSSNEEASEAIVETLMEREDNILNMSISRFFSVALGILFLGEQEKCENIIEILEMIEHPIK